MSPAELQRFADRVAAAIVLEAGPPGPPIQLDIVSVVTVTIKDTDDPAPLAEALATKLNAIRVKRYAELPLPDVCGAVMSAERLGAKGLTIRLVRFYDFEDGLVKLKADVGYVAA